MAQKNYQFDPKSPSGIEVTEEIQALGGGVARVVTMPSRSSSSHGSSPPGVPSSTDSSPSPQVGVYKHDMPITQPMAFYPMDYYDPSSTFMAYPDFSPGPPPPPPPPQPINFLPAEFNDIFGVTGNRAGGDLYGADVLLDQLGFKPGEPWQPMDHVGL